MGAVPIVSLEALTAAAQAENQYAFRKIAACYDVHRTWITHDFKFKHYSRYGRTEMAAALGCSATIAESYVSVGVALHTRLPLVRTAFEAGEIDLPRVRTVCRILDNLSDEIVRMVEDEIVEAAQRNSPGPLEKEIWDILLRVAPEEAAALREFAKRFRHISYNPAGELARIRAELTAPEAAAAWQLLEEMADTLCPKDPRGKQDRLCDAFMARMHGEPRLACLCQREDCPKKDAELPDRRVPLTMITVDIATLIGLLTNPAYLAGHGSIDPDLARELSRNSQWQVLLTEAVTLAEKLGLAVQNPETGEWERRSGGETDGAATGSDAGTVTDTYTDTDFAADAADAPETPGDAVDETAETGGSEGIEKNGVTGEVGGSEEDEESTPVPATDPSAIPEMGAADRARKNAATRAGAPVTDRQADAPSATDPEAAAPSETAPASGSCPEQASPEPDIASNCAQSRSSATPSGPAASAQRPAEGQAPPTDQAPGTDPAPAAASDNPHQYRLGSLASAAPLFCTHTPVGKGTRHSSALDLPSASRRNNPASHTTGHTPGARTPSGIYLGNASLAAALEAAIAADPTLGKTVASDPLTDRALIYRPDALTAAAVRLRDRHCRFPGCQRPAGRCQLDHIAPFDHANPLGGGWTTVNNLQCLCEFHHTVKTAGYWSAVMLPGGAILWRSTSKTTRSTLPANGTAVPILGNDLRPHIPTKPRRSGIIAYPHPPNPPGNEQPETDDTEAPPF